MARLSVISALLLASLFIGALTVGGQALAQLSINVAEQQAALTAARKRADEARQRAFDLQQQAGEARASVERTAAERAALEAEVEEAQAELDAANMRLALLDSRQAKRRERLSGMQGPLIGLVSALQSYARRPAILAIGEPESIEDVVHLRAIMSAIQPTIDARTEQIRGEIARARLYRDQEAMAQKALRDSRLSLADRRRELTKLEADKRAAFSDITKEVQEERQRAFDLGERTRDIIESIETRSVDADIADKLAALPNPKTQHSAPLAHDSADPVYRLPVQGALVAGLGEATGSGFRAKGLTLRAPADARVVAPAGGKVSFAGHYRSFGNIVIIEHGAGWTTLLTGLGKLDVTVGQRVAMGETIGRPDDAQEGVTVELRRSGRPVDLIALLG